MKKYQVVILAGGESSRFYPFNSLHKSFFVLGGKAIIERTLDDVIEQFGGEAILILGSKNFKVEKKIVDRLGFGEKVKCVIQKKSLGQADAILSAKEYINDDFFVINAQQFTFSSIAKSLLDEHSKGHFLATVGSTETNEPWKYGILKFDSDKVIGVVEKPKSLGDKSSVRISGEYLFSNEFISLLEDAPQSEYGLEETLDRLAKKGRLGTVRLKQRAPSIKYPWDLFAMREDIFKSLDWKVDKTAKIAKTALIKGDVYIGKNAEVHDFAIVEGPVYIGESAIVGSYCLVRGGSVLEEGSKVQRFVDIKNSFLGRNSSVHSGFVGDSIIGKNVKIGAGFITANKRLDRGSVGILVKGNKMDTGLQGLGIFVGEDSTFGVNVSSMPGSMIGPQSLVYPNTSLKGSYSEQSVVK